LHTDVLVPRSAWMRESGLSTCLGYFDHNYLVGALPSAR